MKKLCELKNNSRIDISHLGLRYLETGEQIKELNFHHVDGMYSLCTDNSGNKIHLGASTEVKQVE